MDLPLFCLMASYIDASRAQINEIRHHDFLNGRVIEKGSGTWQKHTAALLFWMFTLLRHKTFFRLFDCGSGYL